MNEWYYKVQETPTPISNFYHEKKQNRNDKALKNEYVGFQQLFFFLDFRSIYPNKF